MNGRRPDATTVGGSRHRDRRRDRQHRRDHDRDQDCDRVRNRDRDRNRDRGRPFMAVSTTLSCGRRTSCTAPICGEDAGLRSPFPHGRLALWRGPPTVCLWSYNLCDMASRLNDNRDAPSLPLQRCGAVSYPANAVVKNRSPRLLYGRASPLPTVALGRGPGPDQGTASRTGTPTGSTAAAPSRRCSS